MKATVIYSHKTKFTTRSGDEISGFQTGVVYDDLFALKRCREIWTKDAFCVNEVGNLVFSKKYQKWYLIKINETGN